MRLANAKMNYLLSIITGSLAFYICSVAHAAESNIVWKQHPLSERRGAVIVISVSGAHLVVEGAENQVTMAMVSPNFPLFINILDPKTFPSRPTLAIYGPSFKPPFLFLKFEDSQWHEMDNQQIEEELQLLRKPIKQLSEEIMPEI